MEMMIRICLFLLEIINPFRCTYTPDIEERGRKKGRETEREQEKCMNIFVFYKNAGVICCQILHH